MRQVQQCPHLTRCSVGVSLANNSEMRVSGSDSYALLFLFCCLRKTHIDLHRSNTENNGSPRTAERRSIIVTFL